MASIRYKELDSLRGIAAVVVLSHHFLHSLPTLEGDNLIGKLIRYPFHFLEAGHEAVMLFFILSGFVLSIPFFKEGQSFSYSTFLLKRIFRIYIPYIIAILIALGLCAAIGTQGLDSMSYWFNTSWNLPITGKVLLDHILFLGDYNTNAVDGVIWSLVHEMRISIVFPFVMFFIIRFGWKTNITASVGLSVLALVLNNVFDPGKDTISTGFFFTLHYLAMFIVGATLAKYRTQISTLYSKFSRTNHVIVFVFGFMIYTYSNAPSFGIDNLKYILRDWCDIIGASIFIVFAINSKSISKLLTLKPIHYVGKISFSLYLYHLVVLYSLVYALNSIVPLWMTYIIALTTSFIVASITHYFVEVPAQKLGQTLFKSRRAEISETKLTNEVA